ncbi:nucleoside hydrolase [Flexithrix dorotheae]|uniref:nucleoside hydrolase n=1 Tax=Flexithrix dorotheae TaxID=70993 RepID=UPI00036D28B7|nr:nucleoside hydrolase [Flexithrix dorotheae]
MQTLNALLITIICLFTVAFNTNKATAQQKKRIILDADTGNEVDDLYAISRALIEPSWDILALNATQWQTSHWTVPESMENSHRLNGVILGHLGMQVKRCRGGAARMFDWGDMARHSAAAYEIIKQAKNTPEGEKLTVIALGALTNVASAIYIDPEIESKIALYWLGSSYDFEKGILKKNDFNCVMDVQALEIMLMSKVEMHVIPVNVASAMTFNFEETKSKLMDKHPLGNYLVERWEQHLDGSRKERTIWDLGIIGAVLNPEWVEEVEITTSKDNGNRKVFYYKSVQADKMRTDFFEKLLAFFEKN